MNFGGSASHAEAPVRYTKINLSVSSQGIPIAIGWGRNRGNANIIWYNNFQSFAVEQSAGKGGSSGSQSYRYTTAVILGIGEGPIQGIGTVWSNRDTTTLAALNLTLYLGTASQTPDPYVSANYPTEALSYIDTAYVISSNYDLGSSPDLPSHNFEVIWQLSGTMSGMYDANPADIIMDFCTNPRYGIGLPTSAIDTVSLAQGQAIGHGYWTYCSALVLLLSPYLNSQEQGTTILQRWAQLTNTFIFWSGGKLKFVPLGDTSAMALGATYIPNLDIQYDLTLDDFISGENGQPPITVSRTDAFDAYNRVQIDCLDRSNFYNNFSAQWQDQTSIDQFGQLQAQVISASEVCEPAIAKVIAGLIGQRCVWIRNTYKFTLGYNFLLLEVGDIVSLTDGPLFIGLDHQTVRITEIEETEAQLLNITAEEFNIGTGTVLNDTYQPAEPAPPVSKLVDPGNVNSPLIFEPDPTVTPGAVPQVWVGLSGGQYWGGAQIFVSFDGGLTYSYIGTQTGPAVQGLLTAPLPAHADPDTVNTLSVDLSESFSTIPSMATPADADAGRTLCVVDQEVMAYGNVAVGINPELINLTYLRRGLLGTTPISHIVNANFTRVDPATTFTYNLPPQYVGYPLFFKFLSFNIFGNSLQSLADVDEFPYTPGGVGYNIDPPS